MNKSSPHIFQNAFDERFYYSYHYTCGANWDRTGDLLTAT